MHLQPVQIGIEQLLHASRNILSNSVEIPYPLLLQDLPLRSTISHWSGLMTLRPRCPPSTIRIGLSIGAYIRVGDTFVVTVEDAIGDDSLSGSAWIHQGDSTKPAVTAVILPFSVD